MKEGFDIYQHKRQIEASLKKLEKSDLSKTNKDSILGFYRYCTMQGMSRARLIRYLLVLVQFSRIMEKDFINAEKSDIEILVAKIQEQDVAPWTKHTSKVMLKRFYKWLKGHDEEYPPEVKWIKPTIKKSEI